MKSEGNALQNSDIPTDASSDMSSVSMVLTISMKDTKVMTLASWFIFFVSRSLNRIYRIFTHRMVTSAREFENTLITAFTMSMIPKDLLENTRTMQKRRRNTTPIAMKAHFMYDSPDSFSDGCRSRCSNLVSRTMLHPRISVVTAVESALTIYGESIIRFRIVAP